jgi:hypothetical protein
MKLTLTDTFHILQQTWRSMGMKFGSPACICYSWCRAHSTQTLCNSTGLCHTHDLLHTTERAKFFFLIVLTYLLHGAESFLRS